MDSQEPVVEVIVDEEEHDPELVQALIHGLRKDEAFRKRAIVHMLRALADDLENGAGLGSDVTSLLVLVHQGPPEGRGGSCFMHGFTYQADRSLHTHENMICTMAQELDWKYRGDDPDLVQSYGLVYWLCDEITADRFQLDLGSRSSWAMPDRPAQDG